MCMHVCMHACMHIQWRSKVPKSVWGGGGGTQTRDLCTFGKKIKYKRVVIGYMVIY